MWYVCSTCFRYPGVLFCLDKRDNIKVLFYHWFSSFWFIHQKFVSGKVYPEICWGQTVIELFFCMTKEKAGIQSLTTANLCTHFYLLWKLLCQTHPPFPSLSESLWSCYRNQRNWSLRARLKLCSHINLWFPFTATFTLSGKKVTLFYITEGIPPLFMLAPSSHPLYSRLPLNTWAPPRSAVSLPCVWEAETDCEVAYGNCTLSFYSLVEGCP